MQADDNQSESDYSDDSSSSSFNGSEHDKKNEYLGPLHEAAAKNDVQQLIKLMSLAQSQGNPIDLEREIDGKTPLHFAAKNNVGSSHYDVVEVFLNNGADPNTNDRYGSTPLWYVVKNCNLEMLNLFLRFKADLTHTDIYGSSLLKPATHNFHNLDVLQFLIKNIGMDVNHKDDFGATPLLDAACNNKNDSHYEVLKYLLENRADVKARNNNGFTPLFYLVGCGNWKVVELFLKHNADVHAVTNNGENILFGFDSDHCDLQVMDKLINDFILDVNHLNRNNETPLHNVFYSSCKKPLFKLIKCLLKNGANFHAYEYDAIEDMPLFRAVFSKCEYPEKWFLKNLDYFSFLIDHTDFSVVHDCVNILDHYPPKIVSRWILEHLAKLKFLNNPINPFVQEFIQNYPDLKDYFTKCTEELQVMSNSKPQNSWIDFFNLLVDSRRKLKNYTGNESLIQDYKNNDWLEMFPIYGALMKKKVEKGLRRRKLFDKSAVLLSDCLPIFSRNHLIINNILDCIMSKKNLSKFCE